ncbi:MAG: hypothetical protein AUF67_09625 [Acidobacteria bacterium 13_1_20CM_58_21]|nr:MAG: hypothetical protein AUF67_09625 [Acidobacteria bacterium 13_1_20CM_58_21]
MKRLFFCLALLAAVFQAACGGSGSTQPPPPPPPVGNFSNASLMGQYAFSMSGTEACGRTGSFFGRIGTFTADGNGKITGGVEDVNVCSGTSTLVLTNGSYSIQADGRGTLSLTNITGTTNYSITLSTISQGSIVQTDSTVTAGGSFQKQDTAAFSITMIASGYVFDFSGVAFDSSNNLVQQSIIGRLDADGGGGILNGLFDSNTAGVLSGQLAFPSGAFYQLDAAFPQSGRGTANIAGKNLTFYIVDSTRLKFLSSNLDFPEALVGDAIAQLNTSFDITSLNGPFAFLIGGGSTAGPTSTAGRFTTDGAGNLTSIVIDENNNGGLTPLPSSGGTVTGSYTVDANHFGGGTATWTDSKSGTFSFIFYLASPAKAVFQETDNNITSDGSFLAQTSGPLTASSLAGNYAFNWNGVSTGEDDFVGQMAITTTATSNISGAMDFNLFGLGKQFFNYPFNGSLTLGTDPTGRNTLMVTTTPSPQTTYKFSAYAVDANTTFLVGVDTSRVIAGMNTRQP